MGCGWGSLTLANAAAFPHLKFTSFSNSRTQIASIREMAASRGIRNLSCHVEDYADFCTARSKLEGRKFARIMAIETLEHGRNIGRIFEYISRRLEPDGRVFVQSLVHQIRTLLIKGDDWMGRNFFTGGQVFSLQSYLHYNEHLRVAELVPVSGTNYARTAQVWLDRLEAKGPEIKRRFGAPVYENFRMFYIQTVEAFGALEGNAYMLGYYTFVRTGK